MLSTWHLFIVLLIVLLVFGAGKLPKVMEDIGRGVKGFKKALDSEEDQAVAKPQPPQQTATATIEGEVKKETKS
ncbi:MAG: twin-arginine translocase TatA/TatE family subunit [Magnetococcales bacterium]|nr:twin-arginine translocase TatA/TatE family subunit [Magnetococcales bacterium]